MTCFYL